MEKLLSCFIRKKDPVKPAPPPAPYIDRLAGDVFATVAVIVDEDAPKKKKKKKKVVKKKKKKKTKWVFVAEQTSDFL